MFFYAHTLELILHEAQKADQHFCQRCDAQDNIRPKMHLRLRKNVERRGKKPSNLHSQGIEVDAASTCAQADAPRHFSFHLKL